MNSGMYAALSGNITALQRLDTLANNLANVNTPGFKRDRLQFSSLLPPVANPTDPASKSAPVLSGVSPSIDFSAGPLKETGNPLDVALEGNGFFVVSGPEGTAYTRQGNFRLDAEGRLVTVDGRQVLASGGPLTISGGRVDIDSEGKVIVDGQEVAALDIVDFRRPYDLQKKGDSLFVPSQAGDVPQPAKAWVRQGFIEESNVSPLVEMASLIEVTRYFESCQRAIRSYDDMAAKAANELGKL
jgi:flagellar basal-body rod protein FlgG